MPFGRCSIPSPMIIIDAEVANTIEVNSIHPKLLTIPPPSIPPIISLMCLADAAQARFYHSTNINTHHRHPQSRHTTTTTSAAPHCAADALLRDMRFFRLTTARTAVVVDGGAIDRPAGEAGVTTATRNATTATPTATATKATATNATAATLLPLPRAAPSDASLRRCQSARPHVHPPGHGDRDHPSLHRTRSHSQKTARGRGGSSQQLPIPPMRSSYIDSCVQRQSPPRRGHAEESDLARMYDYATWNMYERIVSARRRRLALIEQQVRRDDEAEEDKAIRKASAAVAAVAAAAGPAKSDAVVWPAPTESDGSWARQRPTPIAAAALHKSSSNDENSTLATADETDRALTTSSWSRADSPIDPMHGQRTGGCGDLAASAGSSGMPSLRRLGFPSSSRNDDGRREATTNGDNKEDDAFIFELDM